MEYERWGDDQMVAMDVDLSVEEEITFLSEICHTREELASSSVATSSPSLSLSATSNPQYNEMLYLVLDTNVLVSHLNFLVELKDYAIKGVGRPLLVIPWVVMQELDALKTRSSAVGRKSRNAIAFLHNCFSAGHPRVKGQTMDEVHTELDNVAIENNDDRILHCCLLYQHKVAGHGGVVALFSNDTQLCSKAMINHVRALNRKTLLTDLRVLCRSMQQATPTSYSHTAEFSSRVGSQVQKEEHRALVDDLLCEGEKILRDSLSSMVTVEMEMAFDSLWITVVSVKPPWTLQDLVHIIEKHWIAVFGQVLKKCYRQENLKILMKHIKSRHNLLPEGRDLNNFISCSVALLKAFPNRLNYKDIVAYSVASLTVLSQKLEEAQKDSASQSVISSSHSAQAESLSPTNFIHFPPTPPSTPALLPVTSSPSSPDGRGIAAPVCVPLLILSVAEIEQLTSSPPALPEHQLPWLLNIILETTKHCLSRLAGRLASSNSVNLRSEASLFMSRLATLLETITSSMQHLLQNQAEVSSLRNFRASLDTFLLMCLQFSCPMNLESMCQLVPLQLQLVMQAVREFSATLDTLHLLAQQFSL